MKTFIGGEIREEFRGNYAAVVARDKNTDEYRTFVEEIGSANFTYLTSKVGSRKHIKKRLYIGVSSQAGSSIKEAVNLTPKNFDFRTLDDILVCEKTLSK